MMRYSLITLICIFITGLTATAGDKLFTSEAKKKILLTGYTRNVQSQTISSEMSGKILKINYDIGQATGNRAFLELDPTFIDLQIESTSQALQQLLIIAKKSELSVSYLEKERLRIVNLFQKDLATESGRDTAEQRLEQSLLEHESALKEHAVLTTTLKELNERKKRHSIYAPRGWVVTDRVIEKGEVIQAGAPLARVSDYRTLVVPLSVSNEELNAIQSLPPVFDARIEGRPVKASVRWINPEFNEKTRKLKIELVIADYAGEKRGGLKFTLPVYTAAEGLYVPRASVSDRYENPSVLIKETGESVALMVLGKSGEHLIVAEDGRLKPGTELAPAEGKK